MVLEIWCGNDLVKTFLSDFELKEGNKFWFVKIFGNFNYDKIELWKNDKMKVGLFECEETTHNGFQNHTLLKEWVERKKGRKKLSSKQIHERRKARQNKQSRERYMQKSSNYL